jgi:hypothetical protein
MTLRGMMESIKPIDFPSRTPCLGYVPVPALAARRFICLTSSVTHRLA